MAKFCPVHQCQAVWKSGTSKQTGKKFAFWACPERMNGEFCKAQLEDDGIQTPTTPQPVTLPVHPGNGSREKEIRFHVALKAAVDILKDKLSSNADEQASHVMTLAKKIYDLYPNDL